MTIETLALTQALYRCTVPGYCAIAETSVNQPTLDSNKLIQILTQEAVRLIFVYV